MDYIAWDEKFSIKIDTIDLQHKKLISLINDVNQSLKSGASRKDISKIFNDMIDYTKEHFTYEENLFSKYSYREGLKHKIDHSNFISKTLFLYGDFVSDKGVDLNNILNFLVEWLQDHILGDDMRFGEFMQGKGVKL